MSSKQYQIVNFGWNPWTIMEVLNLDFHIKHEFSAFLKEKLLYEVNFLGADFQEFVHWNQLFSDFQEAILGSGRL